MNDIELRPFAEPVEVRSEGGKTVLSGVAIRYGARSKNLGGFRERIMPGAPTEAIQKGDPFAFDEHRADRYLGRLSNGTLRLFDTPTELRYEVDLPDTAVGREVAALAERRDYKGSSFGFRANPTAVKWTKDDDGVALRSIHGFALLRDVGPTISPAYEDTSAAVALRSFPLETGLDVEVRSVLEAAQRGELGLVLDGTQPPELSPPATAYRRPAYLFH
jgi:HK97 family phage prohead protease